MSDSQRPAPNWGLLGSYGFWETEKHYSLVDVLPYFTDDPIHKNILAALIVLTGLETNKYILNLKSGLEVERKMCYGVKEVSGREWGEYDQETLYDVCNYLKKCSRSVLIIVAHVNKGKSLVSVFDCICCWKAGFRYIGAFLNYPWSL